MKRLTFITQFKIEFLLPFTGYRKVFRSDISKLSIYKLSLHK